MAKIMAKKKRFGWYWWCGCLAAVLIWLGIQQTSHAIPLLELLFRGIQIIQITSIDDNQEVAIGRQINRQITNGQVSILRDRQINNYINEIGQRLASNSRRNNIPYTFQVVDDPGINAFATMGGFVYVNSGLITAAENEAQLASVLSHEIGHIAARHVIERLKQTAIARGLITAAGLDESLVVNLGIELALNLPNSREDEFQADRLGLENLKASGYAPMPMVDFMQKLTGRPSLPTIFSTHPAPEDRINSLLEQITPSESYVGRGLDTRQYRRRIAPLLE